jgi:hypothetical protein
MKKKLKKIRISFQKAFLVKTKKLFAIPHPKDIINVLYLFLVTISFSYGILIYMAGQAIEHESLHSDEPSSKNPVLEHKIKTLTRGYPIERMSPYISNKDKRVATFLVAIGKKESNWGKISPKKDGRECYNYWGYRGKENPTASGYSCFRTPQQAVNIVGGRIQELVDQQVDTPRKMAVWKCGFDCSWDNPAAVRKWVADVDYYYKKIYLE